MVRSAAKYRRETIKKSRDALAMTLDHHGIVTNVARDKRVRVRSSRCMSWFLVPGPSNRDMTGRSELKRIFEGRCQVCT